MKTIDTGFKLWVHLYMKKSFPFPLIVIITVFLIIPATFWFVFYSKNSSEDVKGAKTSSNGVIVRVSSKNGSWDMSKYLCKDRSECLESLQSGKFLEKTSGGGEDDQFVSLRYSPDFGSYEFLKIYVEPGWGSMKRDFKPSLTGIDANYFIEKFNYNGSDFEAIILPVAGLDKNVFEAAVFSDN